MSAEIVASFDQVFTLWRLFIYFSALIRVTDYQMNSIYSDLQTYYLISSIFHAKPFIFT